MKIVTLVWQILPFKLLVISLFLSWQILSSQNFFYGFFYDNTELEKFIDYFAPKNKYKPEFQFTDREERLRLFSIILSNIEGDVSYLGKIQFYSPEGVPLGYLLNEKEVNHLGLVGNLITYFKMFSYVCFFLLVAEIIVLCRVYARPPGFILIMAPYLVVLFLLALAVFVVGPFEIFVWMHEVIFPKSDQWFFYYQDSLMTTMMMAPKLFGYFAIIWGITAGLIFFALIIFLRLVFTQREKQI